MKSASVTQAILMLGFVGSIAVAVRERLNLNEALESSITLREERAHLLIHRRVLLKSLEGLEWSDPFLAAGVVIGQGFSATEPLHNPTNMILYVVSTACDACALNFPVLNELADQGIPVLGLTSDSVVGEVQEYYDSTNPHFPLLVGAYGSAFEGIPRYGTPTTVVIAGGEVAYLEFGEFSNATVRDLDAITSGWQERLSSPDPLDRGTG